MHLDKTKLSRYMKRKLFIALCAMFCLSVNPHNSRTYTSETLSFEIIGKEIIGISVLSFNTDFKS